MGIGLGGKRVRSPRRGEELIRKSGPTLFETGQLLYYWTGGPGSLTERNAEQPRPPVLRVAYWQKYILNVGRVFRFMHE